MSMLFQQLNGRDAEVDEVLNGQGMGPSGVGASKLWRQVGMYGGKAFDVHLIDDGLVPGGVGVPIRTPVEISADDHGFRHERRIIEGIGGAVALSSSRYPGDAKRPARGRGGLIGAGLPCRRQGYNRAS
jgi:hypothetical protein